MAVIPGVQSGAGDDMLETHDELVDMVREYENINVDPVLRKEYRKKMADKLSKYNEQVLSIALEKMEESKSNGELSEN